MNEHISWGKIGVLVVAIAGIAGVAFVLGKKSDVAVTPAPVVSVPVQGTVEKKVVEQNKIATPPIVNKDGYEEHSERVYVNKEFGFSLEMPESWKKYLVKVVDFNQYDGQKYISFELPFDDPSGYGYYAGIEIYVTSINKWNADRCGDNNNYVEGPCYQFPLIGKNSSYVFESPSEKYTQIQEGEQCLNEVFKKDQSSLCARVAEVRGNFIRDNFHPIQ